MDLFTVSRKSRMRAVTRECTRVQHDSHTSGCTEFNFRQRTPLGIVMSDASFSDVVSTVLISHLSFFTISKSDRSDRN